jgi:tRNA(Arg) A34 adenosine deaminase TadA
LAALGRIHPISLDLSLPSWVSEALTMRSGTCASAEERMQLAIDLADLNVRNQTGGPFGAALFHGGSGELVAVGLNVVIPNQCAIAHAEVMALALAQQLFGTHDLSQRGGGQLELVTSAQPCGMCLGAALWSGVTRIVCGAAREDVESLGFDEGLRTDDWEHQLRARGVHVQQGVLRAEARQVLQAYVRRGGPIYNAARNGGTQLA